MLELYAPFRAALVTKALWKKTFCAFSILTCLPCHAFNGAACRPLPYEKLNSQGAFAVCAYLLIASKLIVASLSL